MLGLRPLRKQLGFQNLESMISCMRTKIVLCAPHPKRQCTRATEPNHTEKGGYMGGTTDGRAEFLVVHRQSRRTDQKVAHGVSGGVSSQRRSRFERATRSLATFAPSWDI